MSASELTPLGVFLECLHIIETLPSARDRERVIMALSNLAVCSPRVLGRKPKDAAESEESTP